MYIVRNEHEPPLGDVSSLYVARSMMAALVESCMFDSVGA